ncbi:hypothetical protein GGI04_001695 [Coemansia thaxteri]|nr:hypothetical protein GGI04_001695 [Coemansia thaxteri]
MFRGDFSSPYTDIFALHKRATKICDKDTKFSGCDIKLEKNYKWGTLSNKLVDTLSMYCKYPEDKKTDFYVKIDDDLIMPESKLEEVLQKMAETPCQYAGGMISHSGFYWALGQMYIIKRSIFDDICKKLPTYKVTRPDAEDITMGHIVDSQDFNAVCELNKPDNHWHIDYEDQRVKINYHKQHNE